MITYQQEFLSSIKGEIDPLVDEEWDEVCEELVKPELDWDTAFALEAANVLFAFTARQNGKLVGYCIVVKHTSLANKNLVIADSQALFVVKECRNSSVASKILSLACAIMSEEGANRFVVSAEVKANIEPLMDKLGFNKIEVKFGRVI